MNDDLKRHLWYFNKMINGLNKLCAAPLLLVVAAVILDNHKVLITRRPEGKRQAGFWEFPGGKVNPGEKPEDALHREIKEELDADIHVERIFEVVHHQYDWGPVLLLAYESRLLTQEVSCLGVADYAWVHPLDLTNFNILPADKPILERLKSSAFI